MSISTGIGKLDELLKGGLGEGSSTLVVSVPGIDVSGFAAHIALANLKQKKKALYFTDNKPPQAIKQAIKRNRIDASSLADGFVFVDGFSSSVGFASSEKFSAKKNDIASASEAVLKAIGELDGGTVFVVDSLSSLLSKNNGNALADQLVHEERVAHKTESPVLLEVKKWVDEGKKNGAASVYLFTDWEGDGKKAGEVSGFFDFVVRLDSVEERFLTRNFFSVSKAPFKLEKAAVPFKMGLEGVSLYVPKVLVTGSFHSGKTSFIHSVSTRAVSVDRLGTTVSLDHGYVESGGIAVDLFGTPGQERFEFMLDILNKEAFGIILIVDSSDPESFVRGSEMLKHVLKYGIPFVVAANKQDMSGALNPEEIRKKLGLPEGVPIIPTIAPVGEGCLDAVKALVNVVIEGKKKK